MNAVKRRISSVRRTHSYDDRDSRIMAIHTGLSVTVAGFKINLDRDEIAKTARVVVNGAPTDPVSLAAVKVAAELLAARARRFLGVQWQVIEWSER